SKTSRELRIFLAGQLFGGGYTVDYDSLWNKFHDFDNQLAQPTPNASSTGSWLSGHDSELDSGTASGGDGGVD
ncbi:MAG: hypothetical protein AAF357_17305, partial [Verrucomicrobiota bacterium]